MKPGLAQRFSLYPLHPPCTDLAQRRQLENRKESKGKAKSLQLLLP